MNWILWLAIIIPAVYFLYKRVMAKYDYFKNLGIPYSPGVPVFGSVFKMSFTEQPAVEWLLELAHTFRSYRFFGLFTIAGPVFVIQDPELMKQISVKEFDHFANRSNVITTERDELLSNVLTILRDQKWKDMRATLSPAFTGSKMRMMFDLIRECAEDFVKYCQDNSKNNYIEINTKDIFSKVTINIISTTAFGLKVDSIRDPSNPVFVNAKKSFDLESLRARINITLIAVSPTLAKFFDATIVPKESNVFFKKLVADTIEHRRKTNEFRPDVIQLLMQAQDGTLKHDVDVLENVKEFAVVEESEIGRKEVKRNWTDIEIAAQCFLFFVAGFDTSSTFLTFACYELAMNQEVQDKIYQEIKMAKEKLGKQPINFETLQKLEYLDAFISEAMRLHPNGFLIERECNADSDIEDHNGKKFTIPKGTNVWFNVYGMHHSHKFFPNPEKLLPERFLGDNKNLIFPNSYLPFGIGPRACIGSRFAIMQAKLILYNVLSNFSIEVCDKTMAPLRYKPGFIMLPKHEMIVEFKKR